MANEMMGLIALKVGMTQIYDDNGNVYPVTVLQAGPCKVLQVKTEDTVDNYNALQLGFGTQKEQRLTKAQKGHFAKAEAGPIRHVREFRVSKKAAAAAERGQSIGVDDVFADCKSVDVSGTSKGAGFSGVMKRYNFAGFIRTHGTHEFFRHGGSIGCRLTPGHVSKGKKMPGHEGAERVTVQNMKLIRIDGERGLLFVNGGVPGPNGGVVTVRQSIKG